MKTKAIFFHVPIEWFEGLELVRHLRGFPNRSEALRAVIREAIAEGEARLDAGQKFVRPACAILAGHLAGTRIKPKRGRK